MNYFDEDEEDRNRRRLRRQENLLVSKLCDKIPFCSVKQTESQDKGLCFGNRRNRETLPVRMSYWNPKHCTFEVERKREAKAPLSPSLVPRFADHLSSNQVPAPNFYKIPERNIRVWRFSKDLPRLENGCSDIPGPGTYRQPHSKSNHLKIISCRTVCSPYQDAVCYNCNSNISGDYYVGPTTTLCRTCYANQRKQLENSTRVVNRAKTTMQLDRLKKVRNCSFYHQHLDTEKAVTHLQSSRKCLEQKLRIENYLARFSV